MKCPSCGISDKITDFSFVTCRHCGKTIKVCNYCIHFDKPVDLVPDKIIINKNTNASIVNPIGMSKKFCEA